MSVPTAIARLYLIFFRHSAFFAWLSAAFARRQQAAEAFLDAGNERRRAERAADQLEIVTPTGGGWGRQEG